MDIYNDIVRVALEESLSSQPKSVRDQMGPDLALFGKDSTFDSLSFVTFIVLVEEKVQEVTGKSITIADEKAFAAHSSPFRTVKTLCEYIQSQLDHGVDDGGKK